MLAKQNNIIIPGLGGVFWTKIFSCCFYGFYWIIKTCCVNPHILNGFSSLGLSSIAILSACTSVKSMNFYGTKNNVWGKCGQQSKLCVRQQLCVLAASPELFMLGGEVWALPSSINLSCASPGVFGVWCLPPPGGVWGAVPGQGGRRVKMQIFITDKLHAALGRDLLSFPSSQLLRSSFPQGERVSTFSPGVLPENFIWLEQQWGPWAPPEASSCVCSSVNQLTEWILSRQRSETFFTQVFDKLMHLGNVRSLNSYWIWLQFVRVRIGHYQPGKDSQATWHLTCIIFQFSQYLKSAPFLRVLFTLQWLS